MIEFKKEAIADCLEEFLALNREHWAEFNKDEPQLDSHFLSCCEMVTARSCGKLIGYALFFCCVDPYYKQRTLAVLDMYYISPNFRRRGLGGILISTVESHVKSINCWCLQVSYNVKKPQDTFYQKLGYSATHAVLRKEL